MSGQGYEGGTKILNLLRMAGYFDDRYSGSQCSSYGVVEYRSDSANRASSTSPARGLLKSSNLTGNLDISSEISAVVSPPRELWAR